MNTFSGKITKERFLEEITKHRKADELRQGTYGTRNGHWKGCAVACSLRSIDVIEGNDLQTVYNQHERYETELGIPEWLAHLEDTIFEGLPKEYAMQWPERFTKAIPVGINAKQLDVVKWKFCLELLKENVARVKKLDITPELKKKVLEALKQVEKVHTTAIKTGNWDESAADSAESAAWNAWGAARSAANRAAESAANSAARSVVESTVESVAWSAERSAESAAWSAARIAEWNAANRAAESAAYQHYADVIIGFLEEVK